MTMSAWWARIGSTSLRMSSPRYWLSASVLTMTSAPSFTHASRPAWKASARPLFALKRTTWSTPCSRATRAVSSVEPSSMISHSTVWNPGTVRGRSASVVGRVADSFRHGIWMISFIGSRFPAHTMAHVRSAVMKAAAEDDRVTVLYLIAKGRSGSNVLAHFLGQLDGWCNTGELYHLWKWGLEEGARCGCGQTVPECELWSKVAERLA